VGGLWRCSRLVLLAASSLARAERSGSRRGARGKRSSVDGTPDGGRHCGELVVGETNRWHSPVRSSQATASIPFTIRRTTVFT
jgi:hypothetical protein